jgi:DNA-binding MarR family transcriptional regulator/N-acetylglutamate synthase-like GNAT family acetyltransferase
VRRFNRFYTQKIGVLKDHLLGSPFSLAEARVLYEIAHRPSPTAAELAADLALDPGYLSRILRSFERRALLKRTRSADDARKSHLALTEVGRAALAPLDANARREVAAMLERCTDAEQARVIEAMRRIEETLGDAPKRAEAYLLRAPRPGDLGWIVQRHGEIYARERRWDEGFEALVAGIVAQYSKKHDPLRERCWIAERRGENVGCVLVVAKTKTVAQLRALLVEQNARGLGIGSGLVDECVRFARGAGYRKIVLWTDSGLDAARRIYERAGFRLVGEDRHRSFGHDLVSQTYEIAL